jgi:hypothetical protein
VTVPPVRARVGAQVGSLRSLILRASEISISIGYPNGAMVAVSRMCGSYMVPFFQHRHKYRQKPISNTAQCAAVAVTFAPQFGIVFTAPRIALSTDT